MSIVKQHGGDVGVISRHGKGSAFWLTLPLQPRDEATATRAGAVLRLGPSTLTSLE